jgi:hypothetical protein
MNGHHAQLITIEALEKLPGWEVYSWEVKDHGILVRGAIPQVDLFGNKGWQPLIDDAEFFVTDYMFQQWGKRYTEETGNCIECCGSGQIFKRWNHETGTKYSDCPDCCGTGKALGVIA